MKHIYLFITASLVLLGCGTQKTLPASWISAKPIDAEGNFVYGVGMSYVNPNTAYQQAARSNALADLAGEVESQIYDESKLLQKEDWDGMTTTFSSQTLMTSHVKLEGYELVDTYTDELRYYTLYRLNLPQFLETKAKNDAIALAWMEEKLSGAKDANEPLDQRYQMLADALQKALDRNFLSDPKFKIETKTKLLSALRTVENATEATFLLPETTHYLGLPEQFSAALRTNHEAITEALTFESSSGAFSYSSALGALLCERTGRENSVLIEGKIDFQRLLPQNSALAHRWLSASSNWRVKASLYFQNTALEIVSPKTLVKSISTAVSGTFLVQEQGPLQLEFSGEEFEQTLNNGRYKHSISGRFILRNTADESVLWSSSRIEKFGLSASKVAAVQAAHQQFEEDIRFFVLPQLVRNLNY